MTTAPPAPSAPTAPTPVPRTLYVHDDLTAELQALGQDSRAFRLGQALFTRLRGDPGRIVILTPARQIDGLVAGSSHQPFALAVGIGRAGVRVAEAVHGRTGWFPSIHRVDLWREEDDEGGYVLSGPEPLATRVGALPRADSIAVVDDTVFSGLTLRTVLEALPSVPRVHAFCMRAVADSLASVAALAPVSAGFQASGRILEDVSFINASGLVTRGAIRRKDRPPLAFYERPEWMAAWFPRDHTEITTLCRDLAAELGASSPYS